MIRGDGWLFVSTMKCATNTMYSVLPGEKIGQGFHPRPQERLEPIHFTICRNPYDRAVSIWAATCFREDDRHQAQARIRDMGGDPENFTDFCRYCLSESFEWSWNDWLFRNQSEWHLGAVLDRIIPIENLKAVEEIVGELPDLPTENKSKHKPWEEYLNPEVIHRINKWAGDDFQYGYEKRDPVTVVCVKWGDLYGPEYVNVLHDMVRRNLRYDHRFICYTDDPTGVHCETRELPRGFKTWWNKLPLFRAGEFKGRVLYLDLDVCITGDLEPIVDRKGIIDDWNIPGYNASVMSWDAGEHTDLWDKFTDDVPQRLRSDQDWMNEIGGWDILPDGLCVSYRKDAAREVPEGASVVCFHGEPKPHECPSKWVEDVWRIGGHQILRYESTLNNKVDVMLDQFEANLERDVRWFRERPKHDRRCTLVGGGPSLEGSVGRIRGDVFALNNTHDYLIQRDIIPDYHVVLDSRPENAAFVKNPNSKVEYLISAFCHPDVFDALYGYNVTLWMADMEGVGKIVKDIEKGPVVLVGGGATVGMKAMYLAYLMGYRKFDFVGFDSCYDGDRNHAYSQPLNDGEPTIDVTAAGKTFRCAPWMAKQAQEFKNQSRKLAGLGCELTVHGYGLIPWIVQNQSTLR